MRLGYITCVLCLFVSVICSYEFESSQKLLHEVKQSDDIYSTSTGVGFWVFPRGCHQDCRVIKWNTRFSNGNIVMRFEILAAGNLGYVAIAISEDTIVRNDAAYICSRPNPESTTVNVHPAFITRNSAAAVEQQRIPGSDGTIANNTFSCWFDVPLIISKTAYNETFHWDLAINTYNLLYMEGDVDPIGKLLKYSYSRSTIHAFDLHRHDNYKSFPEGFVLTSFPQHPQHKALSVLVSPEDEIVSLSGPNGGVWYIDGPECSGNDCRYISWTHKDGLMYFTISGSSNGWIAVAFSKDTKMGDDDCYYCSRQSIDMTFTSAYLTGNKPPMIVNSGEEQFLYGNIIDDRMFCVFTRPFSVTKKFEDQETTWDLSQKTFNLLYAEGKVMYNGDLIKHTFATHTHKSFYFLSNDGYKKSNEDVMSFPSKTPDYITPAFVSRGHAFNESGEMSWEFPENCNENNCKSVVSKTEKYGFMINFTLTASAEADYMGILITKQIPTSPHHNKIIDNDGECYFCWRPYPECPELIISKGECSSTNKSTLTQIEDIFGVVESNKMWCSFLLPIENLVTLNDKDENLNLPKDYFYIAYEEGDIEDESFAKIQTTFRAFTPQPVSLTNTTAFKLKKELLEKELQTKDLLEGKPAFVAPGAESSLNFVVEKTYAYSDQRPLAQKRIQEEKETTPSDSSTTPSSASSLSIYLSLLCLQTTFTYLLFTIILC